MLSKFKKWFRSSDELEQKLADAAEQLKATDFIIKSLVDYIGQLEKRNSDSGRDGLVTIGLLLSAAGGQVKLSHDLIKAMDGIDIHIGYDNEDDGLVLTLLPDDPNSDNVPETTPFEETP